MTRYKIIITGSVVLGLVLFSSIASAQNIVIADTAGSIDSESAPEVQIFPYQATFTITAYYSPVAGQKHYVRGSFEADKKLNGNGLHGADGTSVFPGMIAAPKSIPFGTKMKIPGIGTVSVHDRGGAIVSAGQKGQQHDRLDIWMGQGDEGLKRALHWGRRTVNVMVYGIDDSIDESIDLTGVSTEDFPDTNPIAVQLKHTNFGLGESDSEIALIKQKLTDLKYYQGAIDQDFNSTLYQAVLKFQLDYQVVDSENDFGAGYFGPQTRVTLEKAIQGLTPTTSRQQNLIPIANADSTNTDLYQKQVALAGNGLSFLSRDLVLGSSGQAVLELQIELAKLHLLGIQPTGYYGEVTAHAVLKFQQSRGLIATENDFGAGTFGPLTRRELSELVYQRINARQIIADNTSKTHLLANK